MSFFDASDVPEQPAGFACDWSPAGMDAAAVRVAGRLDSDTAPRMRQVVNAALQHARLIVLNLREVSTVDVSGCSALLDATDYARDAGARLVLIGASITVEQSLDLTGMGDLVAALPAVASVADRPSAHGAARTMDPFSNPVNARVVIARVMDIPEPTLWTQSPDGTIRRAWAPPGNGSQVPAGARVEIYLNQQGAINGWWHIGTTLAINQRHLGEIGTRPERAPALACQGDCQLLWQAPAAAQMLEHHERCLTCAGALVLV